MDRKLASIQKVTNLHPISGADKIEVATILGWEVVVKKGEFKIGDKCIYIEIDSIVPDHPCFEFLRERKFRVKTIRLRGQVSQGLALPLGVFNFRSSAHEEGEDVTELLGIKKHDPQAEQEKKIADQATRVAKNRMDKFMMRYSWWRRLTIPRTRAPFPSFIAKTDETRIQNMSSILREMSSQPFVVTEKLDGQSATYFVIRRRTWWGTTKYEFGVCSRNFHLLKEDDSSYWTIARSYEIRKELTEWLKSTSGGAKWIAIQGEIIGPRIQGNKYNTNSYHFFLFNLKYDNCNPDPYYNYLNITSVPVLKSSYYLPQTVQEIVEYSKGKSVIGSGPIREGIVVRNHTHNISFKVINPDFLIKNDE